MTKHLQLILLYPNAPILQDGVEFSTFAELCRTPLHEHLSIELVLEDCQLSLRPLSSITEDVKRELTSLIGTEHNSIDLDDGKLCWKYRGHFNGYIEIKELPFAAADYLRSKSLCIDLWAVEEGLAVLEE